MLDIKKAREDAAGLKARLALRGGDAAARVDGVVAADKRWREALQRVEALKAERNKVSKEVGQRKAKGQDAAELMARMKEVGAELEALEGGCREMEAEVNRLVLFVPNPPHASVPAGQSAEENQVVKVWGEKPEFPFPPKDHIQLGEALGALDFEAGRRVSGSGFVVYRGWGARLERGLLRFLLDLHTREHGYTEVSPPFLVLRDCMVGTGQLPKFEEDMYGVNGEPLFLAPTAEVPVTNLHRDQILKEAELPVAYAAYTPCFRREAGSYGKETRGLIRLHQFDKVELVRITKPEASYDELEKLRGHAERVLELLGLHYRTVLLCAGDMGFGAAKCYDLEVWAPGEGRYLEVSSCSNFEDFQARRMNLRFKAADGKNHLCHTLNGSGTALARLVVALMETGQRADGSIRLPEALAPYVE